MEAIFFAVDVVGMIWLLYWAIINDDRKPGSPTTGFFAYRESIRNYPPPGAPPPAGGVRRNTAAGVAGRPARQRRRPESSGNR